MDKPMRFVLAGLGFWGRSWAKLLKTHPRVEFVATVDPSESAWDWCREHLELAHFPDLTTALGSVAADAVVVATPPNSHRSVVLEALRHGNHVLVEKPLSANREIIGSNARIFWRGEPDPSYEDRFLPAISLQHAGKPSERLPFHESVGDRRVPVLEHFIHSITHGKQPEPSVYDNLKMLRAIFGCIDSATSGRELVL